MNFFLLVFQVKMRVRKVLAHNYTNALLICFVMRYKELYLLLSSLIINLKNQNINSDKVE